MDQVQLETFLTIAEHKSYSKAAQVLNVTQPTVTARIKNLEKDLVCRLFERIGRQVVLTKEGATFQEYASSIVTYMNHSKEVTRRAKVPNIRIGFSPGYCYSFITEVVNSVMDVENLGLTIIEGEDSVNLNERVIAGELDLVFTRNILYHKPELISEYLFDNKIIGVLSKDHPLAAKEILALNDLQDETVISYRRDTNFWLEIEQRLIGVQNIKRIEVDNNEMLKRLVGSGVGIGITPSLGVNSKIDKALVVKQIEGIRNIPNQVYVQYRKNSSISKPIKKIIYSIINHHIKNNCFSKS